ncbi:hypothetical protein Tsubulata_048105 [Turnera subulata]|uniref:Uncharacterized protein n=1 Tax=Turnera subulata TaxID=218843 RepID=A0A9Q0G111_9ROSI|nr:hypothetical protein Tsubulata_048105 [Turnera subulata]
MAQRSNCILAFLSALTTFISIIILGFAIVGSATCLEFLTTPFIVLGSLLFIISIIGLVGACRSVTWLIGLYIVTVCFIIIILFSFAIFTYRVSLKGAGQDLPGKAYKEYRLGTYSKWLEKRVEDGKTWNGLKKCYVVQKNVCPLYARRYWYDTAEKFYTRYLDSLQVPFLFPFLESWN